ncbi:type ISP restriction/modification enzyme [Rhizobium sp. PL01]|uniref:type ISP restriction/modification enzyme n=1 Tax=Rhizobium sp. PL01 TaxID=3085631 RepID=UPI002980AA2D|nr:type ISP restriction/modification enzyme [Rhizobium sp. PL01]MDW5313673.1 type ISP restriction/modification enzyme [Rhizobium sp. PL01]
MTDRLIQIVERYFFRLRDERGLGTGTKERSYYPALADLLNSLGQELKPKVICLSDLANTGAGHPDFGLYAANQIQKGEPRKGQPPERGVVELKGVADETWLTAETKQVSKYFGAYRLVIVSNLRDFLIIGEGPNGEATKLEGFRLAPTAKAFWDMVATPKKSAELIGRAFGEYLKRALTQSVALREPRDVAWFLASYARDALQRVEEAGELPALANVRSSLEQALGVTFDAEKGGHFFRSTLVQTLFYGVFSAWVIWARETPRSSLKFDWKLATWHLTVPFIRTLFQQIASPAHLQPLRLVEVLDWTAATLNRVDTTEFFKRFNDADAVQFFYEPFLEAFDPELRRDLGVWYTPTEVVDYMVARVDKALRDDLGIEDGLASDRVFILDPCCGTGAFLASVLKRIEASYEAKGLGALKGQMVKQAALSRVFGFEIMPAPFVVAHLQVGLTLRDMGATLDSSTERAGIYLTNALTGWEPHVTKPLPFPELEEERSRADRVKQEAPILVVIGNPPYNGFAGVNEGKEERALTDAYKQPKAVRRPEGQGLNDLYIRFFRMAERRIVQKVTVEKTDLLSDAMTFHYEDGGSGIVCFISNYSWLDGLSFTAMRERYLEAYDAIRIDCLNGDRYKTGKTTPDGRPDPSIFSTEHNREGIQVGTAIATLIRKEAHVPSKSVEFRHLWGTHKRQELLDSADTDPLALYQTVTPPLQLGLPFVSTVVGAGYLDWISLPDLFPVSFPGVKTSRDEFLVDVDRDSLEQRVADYFDRKISNDETRSRYASIMTASDRFDPIATRDTLVKRGARIENLIRYAYRPFDVRWLYWEPETKLLDEKRADYWPHAFPGNIALSTQQKPRGEWQSSQVVGAIACLDLIDRGATNFPVSTRDPLTGDLTYNTSATAISHLRSLGCADDTAFFNAVAILHAPTYRLDNEGALRMDWPRIPLAGDAELLAASAALGSTLASLLNPEAHVAGVSTGALRPGLRIMGLPTKRGGGGLQTSDLAVTAGWGYFQIDRKTGNRKTMAGQGLIVPRDYSSAERVALELEASVLGITPDQLLALVGERAVDVHLNGDSWWSCIPEKIWNYSLGGYQVIKKWLSYREQGVVGRPLKADEVLYVSQMVRRIAAVLAMGPVLDTNYHACAAVALTYEQLSLSRDAARERKEAKTLKRGLGDTRHEAVKKNARRTKILSRTGTT